jgi:hypothetical protein
MDCVAYLRVVNEMELGYQRNNLLRDLLEVSAVFERMDACEVESFREPMARFIGIERQP